MKLPKLNIPLLRRVLRHIKKEPKRFDMSWYAGEPHYGEIPACGTSACIAGWAVLLSLAKQNAPIETRYKTVLNLVNINDWDIRARKLLGLTIEESRHLFFWQGRGESAIPLAEARIKLLIKDREQFLQKY